MLAELEKQYKKALADIDLKIRILESDELTQSRIYRLEHQKALKAQVQAILDKLHADEYSTIEQFLSASYTDGFLGTMYDMHGQGVPLIFPIDPKQAVEAVLTESKLSVPLYDALGVDTKKLVKTISGEISRGIASDMAFTAIARNIANASKAPLSRAKTIVQTESHRIQEKASLDAQRKAKSKGADILKQWNSTLDGDTRPAHRKLDGQVREVEEPFEASGLKAMYPGDFGDPAEDCNCRCRTTQRARWALGEEELQTLKDRAEFFGVDKTEDFEDFKKKYLKAEKELTQLKHDPLTEELAQKRKAVAEYMKSLGAEVDDDGMVTLYHATDKANISSIKKNGFKPTDAPINGGTGGEELQKRVFFGYDKDWVSDTWSNGGNYEIMKVKIPAEYLHQAGQNTMEVFVEGLIKMDGDGIWTPDIKPTSTAWDRKTVKRWAKKQENVSESLENSAKSGTIEVNKEIFSAAKTKKEADDYLKRITGADKVKTTGISLDVENAINNSIGNIYSEFPELVGKLQQIVVTNSADNGVAAVNVAYNKGKITTKLVLGLDDLSDMKAIETMIQEQVEAGYWTPKNGIEGILKHEFAHLLEFTQTCTEHGIDPFSTNVNDTIGRFQAVKAYGSNEVASRVIDQAIKNLGMRPNQWMNLSGYAAVDKGEAFAEALSNADNNKLADEIKRLVKEGFK